MRKQKHVPLTDKELALYEYAATKFDVAPAMRLIRALTDLREARRLLRALNSSGMHDGVDPGLIEERSAATSLPARGRMRTMPEAEQLLPCPFCGGQAVLDHLTEEDEFFVHCKACEIQQIANYAPSQAIQQWNTRAACNGKEAGTDATKLKDYGEAEKLLEECEAFIGWSANVEPLKAKLRARKKGKA